MIREKELQFQLQKMDRQQQVKREELCVRELEVEKASAASSSVSEIDINKYIHLVLPFSEKDVDK